MQVRAVNANGAGAWSDSASAVPKLVPDKPEAPSLSAGDGELVVSWTAPGDGGSAITAYDVRYSRDGGDTWTVTNPAWMSGALSFLIGGLVNGTEYLVQVRAVNANGDGAWSDSKAGRPRDSRHGVITAGDLVLRMNDEALIVELKDIFSGRDHSLPDYRRPLISLTVESSASFVGSRGFEAH